MDEDTYNFLRLEQKRVDELVFWDEVRQISATPKVWHFHPVTFIYALEDLLRPTWDKVTNERIKLLHPAIRDDVYRFINHVEQELSIKLRVGQGLRTIAEQDALYAQGRTTPGMIVTNAKGGRSLHNYGLAIDILEVKDGKAIWHEGNSKEMLAISSIGKSYTFEWGGDWTSIKDYPHFQRDYGYTWKQLLDKINNGDTENGYVKL